MTEEVAEIQERHKIWKNPSNSSEPITYLGEFPLTEGEFFFTVADLRELGLGPGDYTILAPEASRRHKLFSKWQKISIPE